MLSYLVRPCVRCNLKDNFKVELIYCPEFIVRLVTRKDIITKGYCFVIENFSSYKVRDYILTRFGLVPFLVSVMFL